MKYLSKGLRGVFWLVLLAMFGVAMVAVWVAQRPAPAPLNATQVEETVQAAVDARLTEAAALATATPLPDIDATVEARLRVTPSPVPTLTPTPEPPSGVVGAVGGVLGGLWSIISGLWNLFAFGGIGLQLCCCIVIPGGLLLLALNDLS